MSILILSSAQDLRAGQSEDTATEPTARDIVESRVLGCRIELPEDGTANILGQNEDGYIQLLQRDANPPAWEILVRPVRYPASAQEFGADGPPTPSQMREIFISDVKRLNELLAVDSRTEDLTLSGLPAAAATASFRHESGRYA